MLYSIGSGSLGLHSRRYIQQHINFSIISLQCIFSSQCRSMGNSGKNSNSSQFFFTLDQAPQCDGKHVIFGEIVSGHEVLKKAETFGTIEGIPTAPICITDCGIFTPLLTPGAGYWYDKPDAESWNGISPTFMVRPRVAIAAPPAAREKFEEAVRDVCSITLSLGIDPGSGHSVDGKPASELLLESISTFSVDLVILLRFNLFPFYRHARNKDMTPLTLWF